MREIAIDVPVPPAPLWPNARVHYMARARAVKRYRGLCWLVALAESRKMDWGRPAAAASLQATFFLPARKRDPDNCVAALKAAIDGIADAGILANDRDLTILPPVVVPRAVWSATSGVLRPCVVLKVTEP